MQVDGHRNLSDVTEALVIVPNSENDANQPKSEHGVLMTLKPKIRYLTVTCIFTVLENNQCDCGVSGKKVSDMFGEAHVCNVSVTDSLDADESKLALMRTVRRSRVDSS